MSALKTITDLMSETEVYKRFPNIFADKELREARQAGDIEWYNLRKGPHYSEDQLIAYVETKLRKLKQNRPLFQPPGEKPETGSGREAVNEDEALIARALEGKPKGKPRKE